MTQTCDPVAELGHAVASVDRGRAFSTLVEHGGRLVDIGHAQLVLTAADRIPALYDDDRAVTAIAYARLVTGDRYLAQRDFARVGARGGPIDPGLAWRMGLASYLRGAISEAEQVFARGLRDPDDGHEDSDDGADTADSDDSADASILLAWTASARRVRGRHDEARALVQRSARIAHRCADPRAVALSHTVLAMNAASAGDRSQTDANLRRALDAAVHGGDVLAQVRLYAHRAEYLAELGLATQAVEQLETALALSDRTGYVLYRPFVLSHLADTKVLLGRFEEACDSYVAARHAFLATDSPDAAHPLTGLGSNHRVRGDVVGSRAPSRVRIDALGAFRVFRDGHAVPATQWQSKKARDLLKILVSRRGRPATRAELVTLLWSNDHGRGPSRLSGVLSALRSVLGGGRDDVPFLVSDRDAVRLDVTAVDVDVEHFAARAVDALEAWRRQSPDAVALLQDAATAYDGEFCAEDPHEPWASALRDDLATLHLSVVRALADARRQAGEVDEAVRWLLAVLRADPYDESAHLALVHTLHEARRHGDARRRYQHYAKRMTEITVPPEPFPTSEDTGA